ncbi:Protein of unknown function, DUF393 [Paracoccus alcaliphilus]|uniref:Uncharacterized protein n=1 Tax=Paracoccus alcaliphilus TaxID=34002 RepID=A0A1H8M4M2_9RHOB|nr:DUF393 domain-containing protein [Paracoccus alcaliphilus]WCR18362.1 DUF393 domain-containing protein [Paracoccus alcaliphilus]SEO12261.1 Protein of unknown function, DUF393 [Paracoccus alcaliphilus]
MAAGLEIFYDGQCPFCSAYTRMLRLRKAVGRVELIDAREADPRVEALKRRGVDLDVGMVVRHGDRLYHGADAVRFLSALTDAPGPLARLMRSPRRAAALYPVLRAGRALTLRLLGRRPIG